MRERDLVATGMAPEEARRRARQMFGDVAGVSERCVEIDERRDRARRLRDWLGGVTQDVRYALRTLARSPAFALSALAMLALGIGANSTLFTLVDAVVLRPLPGLRDVDSLVEMSTRSISYPTFRDLGDGAPAFAGFAAFSQRSVALGYRERSALSGAVVVSGSYFAVLGGRAQLGRLLGPADDDPGAAPAAVVSDACWRKLLGAEPDILGRELRVNGRSVTIVGVAAPGSSGPRIGSPDLWLPIHAWPQVAPPAFGAVDLMSPGWSWLRLVGRLAPGVSAAQAEAALNVTADRLRAADPRARLPPRLRLLPMAAMASGLGDGPAAFFTVLAGVVTLVLLITCANLANLLLARAARRRRELALRLALGASRGRLIRQLLTEALVLALLASALGLGLTLLATGLLDGAALPGNRDATLDLHLDWRVIGFTVAVSLATGLVFGLAPALRATRVDLQSGLKAVPGGAGRSRLRGLLLTGQVALSLVLLVGAGLFARALQRALAIDPGFRSQGVAVMGVDPGLARFDGPRAAAYLDEAARKVRALPGVLQVSWTSSLPLTDDESVETGGIEGYAPRPEENMDFELAVVGADLPATLGMAVVAGRAIDARDAAGTAPAAMVNETLAHRYFAGAGGDAIGKRIKVGGSEATIVGVTRDLKYHTLVEEPRAYVYLAQAQQLQAHAFLSATALLVRTSVPPRLLQPALERALRATSPDVPVVALGTLDDALAELLLPQRLGAVLLAGFSLLAVLVAALGIFGVVAYAVSQRQREIGIRMALGAGPGSVVRLVLLRYLVYVGAGVGLGLALAAFATRVTEGFLYGLPPTDPTTYTFTALFLLLASLLAAYLPARVAARTNPAITLRTD